MDIPVGEVFVLKRGDWEVFAVLVKTQEAYPCDDCLLRELPCEDYIICPDCIKCVALEDCL